MTSATANIGTLDIAYNLGVKSLNLLKTGTFETANKVKEFAVFSFPFIKAYYSSLWHGIVHSYNLALDYSVELWNLSVIHGKPLLQSGLKHGENLLKFSATHAWKGAVATSNLALAHPLFTIGIGIVVGTSALSYAFSSRSTTTSEIKKTDN